MLSVKSIGDPTNSCSFIFRLVSILFQTLDVGVYLALENALGTATNREHLQQRPSPSRRAPQQHRQERGRCRELLCAYRSRLGSVWRGFQKGLVTPPNNVAQQCLVVPCADRRSQSADEVGEDAGDDGQIFRRGDRRGGGIDELSNV